ncbi:MAG: outer membrane beta-barrel protein [Paludibacter sp.]|nr:outer membrane beta-barrel protein [Paludibacter sp.]
MKAKLFIFIMLFFAAVNLSAQKIGVEAGYIHVTEETNASTAVYPSQVSGVRIGPVSETEIFTNVDFRYGVIYSYLMSTFDGAISGTNYYNAHLIDVPLQLQLGFPVDNALKLFAFAGPNFNFGISQKTINITNIGSSEIKTTYDRYKADADDDGVYDVNRFDLQVGLGAGAQYDNIQLRVGYNWGILDLNNRDNIDLKRNQLAASLVFMF